MNPHSRFSFRNALIRPRFQANVTCNVGNSLFRSDAKMARILDMFSSVGVDGPTMLRNCKFFEHKYEDLEKAIEFVKVLYQVETFTGHHLAEVFSLLNNGRLLKNHHSGPKINKKSVWKRRHLEFGSEETNEVRSTRLHLALLLLLIDKIQVINLLVGYVLRHKLTSRTSPSHHSREIPSFHFRWHW